MRGSNWLKKRIREGKQYLVDNDSFFKNYSKRKKADGLENKILRE